MATYQRPEHSEALNLRHMILNFRVPELLALLGFAGRSRSGNKEELQARALELIHINSTPMQLKIRELFIKSCQENSDLEKMMGQNGQPYYPGMQHFSNMTASMMALSGGYVTGHQAPLQQQQQQGRTQYPPAGSPYHTGALPVAPHPGMYNAAPAYQIPRTIPSHPDIKFVKLPFYDVNAELLRPSTLLVQGSSRFQDAQFQFQLNPTQATDIGANRDIRMGAQLDYLYQIQLRFGQLSLEPNKEVTDEFPPNINVIVNGKIVQLPNPIPTNRQGVEPKRPPRAVNITNYCKISCIVPNSVNVKWAAEYGKGWVVGIWLVVKCSSDDLLDRLKKRGTREANFTKELIIEKLNDTDNEVALDSLKVSVLCPLGKMRMRVPCRPSTCQHLQCFDACTFLLMNEKKSTWNCPVCDSKALYDSLLIDGYFQQVLESSDLPRDENDIILDKDGSWRPVPKDEDKSDSKNVTSKSSNPGANKDDEDEDCIELSDDEEIPLPPPSGALPPLPPPPPLPYDAPPLPPPLPREIECIDLD